MSQQDLIVIGYHLWFETTEYWEDVINYAYHGILAELKKW